MNIIKGMREDFERGWIFVPSETCHRVGLDQMDLFDPAHLDRAMEVVGLLAEKAERYLARGLRYITTIPRRDHSFRCATVTPLFSAAYTLSICRRDREILTGTSGVAASKQLRMARYTTILAWSDSWLRWRYGRLMAPARFASPHT